MGKRHFRFNWLLTPTTPQPCPLKSHVAPINKNRRYSKDIHTAPAAGKTLETNKTTKIRQRVVSRPWLAHLTSHPWSFCSHKNKIKKLEILRIWCLGLVSRRHGLSHFDVLQRDAPGLTQNWSSRELAERPPPHSVVAGLTNRNLGICDVAFAIRWPLAIWVFQRFYWTPKNTINVTNCLFIFFENFLSLGKFASVTV